MAVLAKPTLRPLPVAGAALGCGALGAAMLAGPEGAILPAAALGLGACLLLALEVGRRAVELLRTGAFAYVAVGVLVLLVGFGAFVVVPGFVVGGRLLGALVAALFAAVGLGLVASSAQDGLSDLRRGLTPWQALAGGPTGKTHADEILRRVGPLLLGILFLYGALWFGAAPAAALMDFAIQSGRGMLGFAFVLAAVAVAVLVGAVVIRFAIGAMHLTGAARAAGAQRGPGRSEQAMAAHLHDSVLQTLALIQRQADDPQRVAQLARQQERSLRSWLAGRDEKGASTLAGAVRAAAQEVEDESPGSVIEVVTVGDAPIDRQSDAMVRAAREAMRNAVRHAGGPVRVFVEVEEGVRELFVRDTGGGFDLARVADERRGVRDAIIGRMEHVGGTAQVESSPTGTEVALRIQAPPAGDDPFRGRA